MPDKPSKPNTNSSHNLALKDHAESDSKEAQAKSRSKSKENSNARPGRSPRLSNSLTIRPPASAEPLMRQCFINLAQVISPNVAQKLKACKNHLK